MKDFRLDERVCNGVIEGAGSGLNIGVWLVHRRKQEEVRETI